MYVVATLVATLHLMYEYRKLSEIERAELLRYRRESGYPLHAPPHPGKEDGCFMITAANFEHKHILVNASRRREFEILLLNSFGHSQVMIKAWSIMPNHYHLLLCTNSFDLLAVIFKQLHGNTSYRWNREDQTRGRRVWFKYSDRKIRTEDHFFAALNYIHHNPVKHGYVSAPEEWPWSSFHLYLQDYGIDWMENKWESFPVLDFGKGWDD
jgi:putative transposase